MEQRDLRVLRLVAFGVMAAGVVLATAWGVAERASPARCPDGLVIQGPRCCAPGQTLSEAHCTGRPVSCPPHMETTPNGCVARKATVPVPAGLAHIQSDDWESAGRVTPRSIKVGAFAMDAFEVTHARWAECVADGACAKVIPAEAGQPVTGIRPEEAAAFCRQGGGRLPTSAEFWLATRGPEGRRFPWGPTGLVCRRAAYGLVEGPCGTGARVPELAGARPDGATSSGIFDLAGNVAEWTTEESGHFVARGGSFRARVAADLTPLGVRTGSAAGDIGFRCVYPTPS